MWRTIAVSAIPLHGGDTDLRRFASSLPSWQMHHLRFESRESRNIALPKLVKATRTFERSYSRKSRSQVHINHCHLSDEQGGLFRCGPPICSYLPASVRVSIEFSPLTTAARQNPP